MACYERNVSVLGVGSRAVAGRQPSGTGSSPVAVLRAQVMVEQPSVNWEVASSSPATLETCVAQFPVPDKMAPASKKRATYSGFPS